MLLIRIPPHTVKQNVVAFLVFGETAELFCKIIAHVYLERKPFCFCPEVNTISYPEPTMALGTRLEVNIARMSGVEQPIKLREKQYPPPEYILSNIICYIARRSVCKMQRFDWFLSE